MKPHQIYELDEILISSISISNAYLYSLRNDQSYIIKFLNQHNYDYSIIDLYAMIIWDMLKELEEKDYDLQYSESIVNNGKISPPAKKDTVITTHLLSIAENIQVEDLYNMSTDNLNELLYSFLQVTTNGVKFQLKYAHSTLVQLLSDEDLWDNNEFSSDDDWELDDE